LNKPIAALCLLLPALAHADLLGILNPADMAGQKGTSTYIAANYLAANDFAAVNNFTGDWNGTYAPHMENNIAVGIARMEGGVTYDTWRIAAFYRAEAVLKSNRDTADIYYYSQQNSTIPSGRAFNLNLSIEGFSAKGIRLDKGFNFALTDEIGISIGTGISILRGIQVRMASVRGTAATSSSGYVFNANMEDSYSNGTYPFISDATPYGDGYALDIGAKIKLTNGVRLDFAANDLVGQMTWQNIPHTVEAADSQNMSHDANGYIIYIPTFSGKNDINRSTLLQTLAPKMHTQLNYPVSEFNVFAGTDWMMGYWFPEIGAEYFIQPDLKTLLSYDSRFNSVAMGMQYKWVDLTLRSSRLDPGTSKINGFNAALHIPF
jgi:hypothetical protein